MTATATEATAAAAALSAVVAELIAAPLSPLTEPELLDTIRMVEQARRQLEYLDHVLVSEIEARNVPARHVLRGTSYFLAGLLTLSPAESSRRVRQARELGPRVTLTGDRLEPLLPATAAARADGAITAQHADVIARAVGKVRHHLAADHLADVEHFLVEQAQLFDAKLLAGIARQLIDTVFPDGALADEEGQQRRRQLSCLPNGDGMYRISGDLDAETSALAMSVLHALAAPRPTDAGGPDERSAGQRLHDAFRAVLRLALRSGELPATGGVPATVLITMTAEQFESRSGLATTSFGERLRVEQALRLADQAAIAWIVHNSTGGILNYGTTRRLASSTQTLALIARDQGCTFPGCMDPPEWTEKHHITPWARGGPTDLENLCLLCDFHHDRFDRQGWQITMHSGVPWFVPPAWLDAEQKPLRNVRPALSTMAEQLAGPPPS
ncbi:MAG TPA: DUF222 domain-containing protein [Jatrophihabitans sp.]|jgi:hypothetical protein|nr:DUF222 domain-containing protein [Jatrophihabitans sp.]